MLTKKQAIANTGNLSTTSKMPCDSWGIPATTCKTGSKLAQIEGTVCSGCYALKGAYTWKDVNNAYSRRLEKWSETPTDIWIESMIVLIKSNQKRRSDYFRWFDSGDIQSIEMLEAIVKIAYALPTVKFWLPTKERKIVQQYIIKYGEHCLPDNLVIRISEYYVDSMPKTGAWVRNIKFSAVGDKELQITCPSSNQHGRCDDCRKCWDSSIECVTYKRH